MVLIGIPHVNKRKAAIGNCASNPDSEGYKYIAITFTPYSKSFSVSNV
jgi:hypothetical protein